MWSKWFKRRQKQVKVEEMGLKDEIGLLYHEIIAAKRDWDNALRHFEYAVGKDHVDYAIFAIEAAEKRYEMLLRKAKAMNIEWSKWIRGLAV
ncbi:YaaL family protein [Paenibacillus sp. sptzw28]|uniref:YaaL family protein n=1 Tax=Paenibacillus sp. sptzw28 TaxID=715179 RepID=UPI00216366A3|nr:YaaL family protein [Paenibacillus sp. sptzw28]